MLEVEKTKKKAYKKLKCKKFWLAKLDQEKRVSKADSRRESTRTTIKVFKSNWEKKKKKGKKKKARMRETK